METTTLALGTGSGRTAEAVRARSRDLYELLLDRIEQRVNGPDEFTLSELSQAANVAGRIGLGGEEQRDTAVVIRIVRDSVTQPHALPELDTPKDMGRIALPSPDDYATRVTAMARCDGVTDDESTS